jgi:hypothetical protein
MSVNVIHHHQNPTEHYTASFAVNSYTAGKIRHSRQVGVKLTMHKFASWLCFKMSVFILPFRFTILNF